MRIKSLGRHAGLPLHFYWAYALRPYDTKFFIFNLEHCLFTPNFFPNLLIPAP